MTISHTFNYYAQDETQTLRLGELIGRRAEKGDVILLIGELGSGKTWLTKGIARGLGVPEDYPVTSPTFTLVNEYPGRVILYHLDLYRLETNIDWLSLGIEEYLSPDGVTVVEWADKLPESLLPERYLRIHIDFEGSGRCFCFDTNIEHFKQMEYDLALQKLKG